MKNAEGSEYNSNKISIYLMSNQSVTNQRSSHGSNCTCFSELGIDYDIPSNHFNEAINLTKYSFTEYILTLFVLVLVSQIFKLQTAAVFYVLAFLFILRLVENFFNNIKIKMDIDVRLKQ